jgi:acyl-homoserine-lactone acylase
MMGHNYPRLRRRGRAGGIAAACAAAMLSVVAVPGTAGAAVIAGKPAGPAHGRYVAEIRRTAYGIPHILARDFGSLGYGYGYAFAQDNLCSLASQVLTLRGQRSRYFGPGASSGDPLAPATNLASDIYYQGLLRSQAVRRLLARPAPLGPTSQVRQLVEGYAAGYNRYLRDTGTAHLPDPTCRGAAWVHPITPLDIWTLMYNLDQTAGADQFKQDIATASPPSAGTRAKPVTPAPAAPRGPQMGSNAIGLGQAATVAHDGMLLANPHFPWAGPDRFYQVQLTIRGVLNVAGASLYGTPVVEIGHTTHLAWTHTVSTAQRYTLYQLALVPGKPTSYLVDGRAEKMTTETVHVTVRGAGGQLSTVTRTLYRSRYGPVVAGQPLGWTATTAFAIRDANAGNLRSVNEWLAMDSSDNLAQLRAAQRTYQGLPFVNTIAADASGRTYFADASVVPHVTDQEAARCIDTPQGKAAYPAQFILDGSTSACQWGRDPGAIEPGIFAPGHDPQLSRSDYVTNSNDSPWLANPADPITGYPRIFGDIGTARSLRTRLGLDMVAQRLAGTDGLGPPGFTLPTLQATMLGDRDYSAEVALAATVAMCRADPVLPASDGQPVDVRAACDALADWNGRGDPSGRGAVLWREFFNTTAQANPWQVPFDPAHPLTTPRVFDTSLPAVQHAFADVVHFFQAHHISLGEPLGAAQRYADIPVPGCTDTEGCFNVVDSVGRLSTSGVFPDVTDGSSFIMAVELTPARPRTRTILTYSESANPASPHYTDQTVLFSRKQWVTERFTQAQISSDPQLRITTLRGPA